MTDNLYVTRDGQIQNTKTGNWLKGDVNNCGYRRIQVNNKRFFVHRLVAMAYLPNPDNLPQVNHKDGNKKNNHVNNLEWCCGSHNQQHRYYELKKDLGEDNSNSKLTEEAVRDIRSGRMSGRAFARFYNISQTLVRKIIARTTWKHVI